MEERNKNYRCASAYMRKFFVVHSNFCHHFCDFGKNAAKRSIPLYAHPRAIAHGYYYFAPLELIFSITSLR